MHKLFTYLCSALLLVTATSCEKKTEKLLLGGSGWNKIVIIDKNTKQVEWEHPLEKGWECNSAVATPDGNILFAYARGAKLIDRNHQEIWNIAAPDTCEMQTARGNYLMPLFATSDVREISPRGEVVKITRLEGTPFTTLALANGNHWVACGDGHSLMEVNLDNGEVARRYGENDIKGARLFFVAGLLPAKDGGLYVCNWQGHDKNAVEANSPQVFEINDKGEVIWNLNDNEKFGMISTISTIE